MGYGWNDFDYARNRRMTLGDFMMSSYIAQLLGWNDFRTVYMMKANGRPYREICRTYGLNWGVVQHRVNNNYLVMNDHAVKSGFNMWALNDILD